MEGEEIALIIKQKERVREIEEETVCATKEKKAKRK